MNLSKNNDGEWVCNPSSKCKTESTLAGGEQTCSIHNKVRTLPNLEKNKKGEWICVMGARCKVQKKFDSDGGFNEGNRRGRRSAFVPSYRSFNGRHSPYSRGRGFRGGRGSRGNWSMGTNRNQVCSLHGKERTLNNLINDGGRWVCDPLSQCRVMNGFGRGLSQMGRPGFGSSMGRISRSGNDGYGSGYESSYPSMYPGELTGGLRPRGREFGEGYGSGRDNFGGPRRGSGLFIPGRRGGGSGPSRRGGGFGRSRRGRGRGSDNSGSGVLCRVHGKFRTRANMESTENGGWECLPNSKCK